MKAFEMRRGSDESGISGTGKVLEGVIFDNSTTVVYWVAGKVRSFGIYDNFYEFHNVHVASHPTNNTEFIFFRDNEQKPPKRDREQLCRHCKNTYENHPTDKQGIDEGFRRSCAGNKIQLIKGDV